MIFKPEKIIKKKKTNWGWEEGDEIFASLHLGKRGRMLNVGAWRTGGA